MASDGSVHVYFNWAKERIDEMEAALASLQSKAGEVQAGTRAKAEQLRSDLRKKCDGFRDIVKKQEKATEAAWIKTKAQTSGRNRGSREAHGS
jgi:ElaB/YqjD/DUF883 family membrane-anchored ribosome-binding protein